MSAPRIFHVFSTFKPAGPQVRNVALINWWGPRIAHRIMAMDGDFSAASRIDPGVSVELVPPPGRGNPLGTLRRLRRAILSARPDLLVTYNWGAIESTLACSLPGGCPVVHLEHGFGLDEARVRIRRRVIARRFILNRIYKTIVPSSTLLDIALNEYRVSPDKVAFVPNGVDTRRFHPRRNAELRRALGIPDTDIVFGFMGLLRPEKNLPMMLRSFRAADLPGARLLLVGDGVLRAELESLRDQLQLGSRVIFSGATDDAAGYYSAMDCFLLSSITEQMPMSLIEAMATGLPALCTDVGDMASTIDSRAAPWVVCSQDEAAFTEALRTIAAQPQLRVEHGARNRRRCVQCYSFERMAEQFSAIYGAASGRPELTALAGHHSERTTN